MSTPTDAQQVLSALRLGWYVAEVRGRNRPDTPEPPGNALPNRKDHVLPLHVERTRTELRIEAQAVLIYLTAELKVDDAVGNAGEQKSLAVTIDDQAKALHAARTEGGDVPLAWDGFASSLYELDAHTQDTLAAQSVTQAAGYQLGRGLAEVYWALNPTASCVPPTPDCWTFLLGKERCDELTLLTGRLSAYFNSFTPPALAGTLDLWTVIANHPEWRAAPDAHADLYQQVRRWYGLLVLDQDPSTLIKPYEILSNWQSSRRLVQALWLPLAAAAISLGLVVALIALTAYGSHDQFLKALFGVLGAAGLSLATIQTKLKNAAQSLVTRLHQDAYTDLVALAIAVAPHKPGTRRQGKAVRKAMKNRSLTTVAEATLP